MPITAPEIQVACAVIWRGQQIVLSKRSNHVPQPGLWEFPGGKFEAGETPVECLARELSEELGITILTTRFMFQIAWNYCDKRVRLWIFEVPDFEGEPTGREGQMVKCFDQQELSDLQFPEASIPIVRAIFLPRYARIYSAEMHPDPVEWASQVQTRSLLYFRDVTPSDQLSKAIGHALRQTHAVILTTDQLACHRPGVGIHLRKTDPITETTVKLRTLQNPWPITCGIRTLKAYQALNAWPFDVIFISPVIETTSHPGLQGLGWMTFEAIASAVNRPVYALGGLKPDDLLKVTTHLGFGVAGIRGF